MRLRLTFVVASILEILRAWSIQPKDGFRQAEWGPSQGLRIHAVLYRSSLEYRTLKPCGRSGSRSTRWASGTAHGL
ncbi:hypothetical protein BDN72DRAFT_839432 [Pluteus cervinus]|uniref:Uncharacterized protein n=1 Tax=Pluteus cervinus TaxID=181527 RepID=A0ACD3AXN1_9AGAR|nr:hypothetical protein BDN72DRAFT_839432 [Pluteus cervinus]